MPVVQQQQSPYTYSWKRSNWSLTGKTAPPTIEIISTSNNANLSCNSDYSYSLVVTDFKGCRITIDVPCCNGVKNMILLSENNDILSGSISVYTNPTVGTFKISGILASHNNRSNAEIQIFSMLGDLIYQQQNIAENTEINLENISNGVYFVKIIENNNITNLKLILI